MSQSASPEASRQEVKRYYHYCSTEAAMGILKNQVIWHSDIHYMNDASEFAHGTREINAAYEVYRSHDKFNEVKRGILNSPNFKKFMGSHNYASENTSYIFIACFSDKQDSLNQWTSYAHGGICLEFETKSDESIFVTENEDAPVFLKQCVYEDDEKIVAINQLFEMLIDAFGGYGKIDSKTWGNLLATTRALACRFKESGFSHESEHRNMIFLEKGGPRENEVQFRVKNGVCIPYIEKRVDLNKLRCIRVGPHPNRDLILLGIRDFEFHLENVPDHPFIGSLSQRVGKHGPKSELKIRPSALSYRPF